MKCSNSCQADIIFDEWSACMTVSVGTCYSIITVIYCLLEGLLTSKRTQSAVIGQLLTAKDPILRNTVIR